MFGFRSLVGRAAAAARSLSDSRLETSGAVPARKRLVAAAPSAVPVAVEYLESRTLMSATAPLYTADNQGRLFTLDLPTGQTHLIGRTPVILYDIAFNKSGQLYGVDSNSVLYKINSTNAAVTRIGSVGSFVNGLTFAPNGALYASGHNGIYTVNTATGHGTLVGTLGSNTSAGDLAFDSAGHLYLSTNADKLVRIDLSAHKYAVVGNIGFHQVYGLGFSNGVLYGLSNLTEQAFKINTTTGHGTLLSNFGKNVDGATGASFKL